jgi:hypothetical protein
MRGDKFTAAGLGSRVQWPEAPGFNFLPFSCSSYIVVIIARLWRFIMTMALKSGDFLPPFPRGTFQARGSSGNAWYIRQFINRDKRLEKRGPCPGRRTRYLFFFGLAETDK